MPKEYLLHYQIFDNEKLNPQQDPGEHDIEIDVKVLQSSTKIAFKMFREISQIINAHIQGDLK
jgi:hypothetical protein